MPMPSMIHAATSSTGPVANDSSSKPAASTALETASRPRPPNVSMKWPTRGPSRPAITSAPESAPKITVGGTPRSRAIGAARIAGR